MNDLCQLIGLLQERNRLRLFKVPHAMSQFEMGLQLGEGPKRHAKELSELTAVPPGLSLGNVRRD